MLRNRSSFYAKEVRYSLVGTSTFGVIRRAKKKKKTPVAAVAIQMAQMLRHSRQVSVGCSKPGTQAGTRHRWRNRQSKYRVVLPSSDESASEEAQYWQGKKNLRAWLLV